ncbi:MAG: PASTA domain-containing protein [Prevotella sp.]|jgi:beta-lactam-binding protein with PASTA domain|nr:PASTA domain-containing protein [Prevotella sp.]
MNVKEIWNKIASHYVLLNLFAMAVVIVLLCVAVKFGLDLYTHHGEGIAVPELKGMSYHKARLLLEEEGLNIIVSDSGYQKTMPADCILAQTPGVGTKVKAGHAIYVTVNSPSSPTFAIPDIVDNSSYREAEAKLMAMGFRLTEPQRVVGEKDWVYGIISRGRRVSNGDRVPIDYPLTLMIGTGSYDEEDSVLYEYVEPTYEADPAAGMNEKQPTGDVDEFIEVTAP